MSVTLSTSQGQGQVTKGHERSPESKNLFFGHAEHSLWPLFQYNSKIEAILQSDFMQVNNREGSGQPWVM